MSQNNPFLSSDTKSSTNSSASDGARAVDAAQGWTWIASGFELFKKQPGMWIGIVVLLFVILIVLAMIPVLGAIATFLLMPVFTGGLMLGCQSLQRQGTLEIGHLFAGFQTQTGNLIVLGAISLAASIIVLLPVVAIVGAGAFFGMARGDVAGVGAIGMSFVLAVLIVMGLSIFIYMALWFAPALVVLRGAAPVAAIKQSFGACLRNILPFLIYGLVVIVLSILASIPFGLGWLVLGPVLAASVYTSFRDIFGEA